MTALALALLLVSPGPCRPDRDPGEGLPGEIKRHLRQARELAPCSLAALPPAVRAALLTVVGGRDLAMADPGQEWNSTDLGRAGLARRQLARAASAGSVWVVDYQQGGIATTYRVAVIVLEGEQGRVLWAGRCHRGRGGRGKWQCAEVG